MAKRFSYEWPRPAVTVDIVLLTVCGSDMNVRLQVLLVERGQEPFKGNWALPGGFLREDEDLGDAAMRELEEETGVRDIYLEQVGAVGTPGRDPRGHTVTVVYVALVRSEPLRLAASGDVSSARWFDLGNDGKLPPLAFDHETLLEQALEHLQRRLGESPAVFELLPRDFTLSELQTLCETILGRPLDRRNFRRKIQELGYVAPTKGTRREGRHRPAQLFHFQPKAFAAHQKKTRELPF